MKKILLATFTLCLILNFAIAQNVGIGTTLPRARLHVADSNVVFTGGTAILPAVPNEPPIINGGVRLMWYPDKGAFRAGGVPGTNWNKINIGNYSIGLGYNPQSRGDYSFAAGQSTTATGISSFAANYSTTARGNYSTAFGEKTTANSYGSLVLGRYNIVEGDVDNWVGEDPVFVIGNGTEEVQNGILSITRNNAITVRKNGNTTITGHTSLTGGLTASGGVTLNNPSISNVILNGNSYVPGKIYYRVSIQTVPINQGPVYTLYTPAATFFEIRVIRRYPIEPLNHRQEIELSDGQHIGEVITIYCRSASDSELPALPPDQTYGNTRLRDNIEKNVNIAGDFNGDNDATITLMWNGSLWVELSRSEN